MSELEKSLRARIADLERINEEWERLFLPIDALVRPLTPLGESVIGKALEIIKRQVDQTDSAAVEPYAYEYWFKDPYSDDIVIIQTRNKEFALKYDNKPLYEHLPAKPQRITEQDARQIVQHYKNWRDDREIGNLISFDEWFYKTGNTLLDKLNEHREPVANNKLEVPHWVEIDSAEDAPPDEALVLWDGCDLWVDYVDTEVEYGTSFFANGTEATHYLAGLTLPPVKADDAQ